MNKEKEQEAPGGDSISSLPPEIQQCLGVLLSLESRKQLQAEERLRRVDSLHLIMNYAVRSAQRTTPQQADLIKALTRFSHLLQSYASTCAYQSLREHDPAWIQYGLTALALENLTFDWRDTLVTLSLLGHSARKLNVSLEPMVQKAATVAHGRCATVITEFYNRAPEDQTIEVMGFREGKEREDVYVQLY